jgi:xylulokinase
MIDKKCTTRDMYCIGIDLGTSAAKFILVDECGDVLRTVKKEYPLHFPKPGWSEQNPSDWWAACETAMPELLSGFDASLVAGIGVAGQMHGLVALDKYGHVLRPAILWNDGRAASEVEYLNESVGRGTVSEETANIAFAGFTAPKLLWMRRNEPELFQQISKIMLPKDYINYKLTGVHACDYSDASGMLLLDVRTKSWSKKMCEICGVAESWLPKLHESNEIIGTIEPAVAERLGLPRGVAVCAGAGDNAAAAIGTGTVGDGGCNISLGTSGTIFISSRYFIFDPHNALHSFAHADGGYHLLGCMLSAASCNKWLYENILSTGDYDAEQRTVPHEKLGKNHVFFLPYLMGERSPINDVRARGTFTGMTMETTRTDIVQAVLEGVAFAIRDSFEVARSLGIHIPRSVICGGGSKAAIWREIFANVLGIPLDMAKTEQGPGYGAAILALVGCGVFPDVGTAARELVKVVEVTFPDRELTALYDERYRKFRKIYPAMKQLFAELAQEAPS